MEEFFEKPPHDNTHTACGTPNPPWWCNEDQPAASIDGYLIIAFLIGIIIYRFK